MASYNQVITELVKQFSLIINQPDKTKLTKSAIAKELADFLKSSEAKNSLAEVFQSAGEAKPKRKTKAKTKTSDPDETPKQLNWGQLWTSKLYGCKEFFSDEFNQFAGEHPDLKGFAVHNKLKETLIGGSEYQRWIQFCRDQGVAPETEPPTEITPKKPKAKAAVKTVKKAEKAETEGEEQPSPSPSPKASKPQPKGKPAPKKPPPKRILKPTEPGESDGGLFDGMDDHPLDPFEGKTDEPDEDDF